jgi:putative nucleotidyltransferase with HDIG domain
MDARKLLMRRTDDLSRSITLLRAFLLASALILIAGGAVLGWSLSRTLWNQAVSSERSSLARYVDGVVRPSLVRGNRVVVTRGGGRAMRASFNAQHQDVVSVKVWEPNGRLAWTDKGQSRIGHRFKLEGPLETAIEDDHATSSFVSTSNADEEDDFEAKHSGLPSLLQVYAPIAGSRPGQVIGAYEIYANPASVNQLIGSRRRMIWLTVAAVFLALWAALALLVRSASRRLVESNRLLEESALEAVASLNETVDAKDPYTAGHSLRVQRIAVEIGREMGLDRHRLETLHFAGLFHDIGKIGVPDAILTKPARLTDEEFEVVKRHPEDGARIVGRLRSLQETVPAILHHHERWDGTGYPHALRAEEIPVEAGVVGLADAFDAMTTDRPYSDARSLEAAVAEIVRNRGTQFAPAVVDAFLRVTERKPEQLAAEAPIPALVSRVGSGHAGSEPPRAVPAGVFATVIQRDPRAL